MKYRVSHITRYRYEETVSLCHNIAHLKPMNLRDQHCFASQLNIHPAPSVSWDYRDFFGNRVTYFGIQRAHRTLEVTALSEVEVHPPPASLFSSRSAPWEEARDRVVASRHAAEVEARLFTLPSSMVPGIAGLQAYAEPSFAPGRPIMEAVEDLMRRIYEEFSYDPHFSSVATPLRDVLDQRRGVCQDFAHLAVGCLRAYGVPARYVSGYIETLPPPGQPKLKGADASHAWFSVFVPDLGWMDFDPTNNQMPGEQHIITAVGRDFNDVTPLKGVLYGGSSEDPEVLVDVERL